MSGAYVPLDGLREICHDIRQPIAGVLALANAALVANDLPEDTRNRLEHIIGLAEWQSDVVESYLEVSCADWLLGAGHTDAVQVVNAAAAAERLTWPGQLILRWPPERVFTRPHPVILRRMTANLLANATRAAGPAGTVIIEVFRRDGLMLLTVQDDGPGFGRVSPGSGLGLSAVARQAAQHQGRLECGRGSLGGAQVSLWLPLAASQPEAGMAHATCPL
jgi:signal transduction histidine kinase